MVSCIVFNDIVSKHIKIYLCTFNRYCKSNYATLRDFIDNAPETQQQEFWKKVAEVAKKFMNENGKVWISVHGLGVDYTHVRISTSPKYYFDNELKKE